jgi:hypothetical protein
MIAFDDEDGREGWSAQKKTKYKKKFYKKL